MALAPPPPRIGRLVFERLVGSSVCRSTCVHMGSVSRICRGIQPHHYKCVARQTHHKNTSKMSTVREFPFTFNTFVCLWSRFPSSVLVTFYPSPHRIYPTVYGAFAWGTLFFVVMIVTSSFEYHGGIGFWLVNTEFMSPVRGTFVWPTDLLMTMLCIYLSIYY